MSQDPGLYVARPLANRDELARWIDSLGLAGFDAAMLDDHLHVTIAHSRRAVPWEPLNNDLAATPVRWGTLGTDRAVVLFLESPELELRWSELRNAGAAWGFPAYQPHVTLFYLPPGYDSLEWRDGAYPPLPPFDLVFGREVGGPLDSDVFAKFHPSSPASPMPDDIRSSPADGVAQIAKLDDEKQIVWGWASVSTKKGQLVVDHQGDFILTTDLQDAAHDFMKHHRTGGEMHATLGIGTVVDSVVLTVELQKALGIEVRDTDGAPFEGWLIGVHVEDPKVWKRVKSGELRAFSIGGSGVRTPMDPATLAKRGTTCPECGAAMAGKYCSECGAKAAA